MNLLNLVAFVAFATTLATRATDPVMLQIASTFDVTPATAALLASAFALPYAAVQPVLGPLADMVSKTRLMTVCLSLLVLSSAAAMLAVNFPMLMAMRALAGIAAGGIFPIALALVGDRFPVETRQVAIGRLLAAAMMGNLLGASGAGVLGDLFGWRSVFAVNAGIGLLVFVMALSGFRRIADAAPGRFDLSSVVPNYRAIFRKPQAKYCFGIVFVEAMLVFGLFPHVANLLAGDGEGRAAIAGIVIAGFGIGAILYTVTVSTLLRYVAGHRLMLAGGLMMGLSFLVTALRLPWPYEFANFLLLGFGMYFLHGYIQVVVTELVPAARGSALAVHSAAFFFGQAVGPLIYGWGFAAAGVGPTLLTVAAILASAGFVASVTLRRAAGD
ncbi:MAG TPA: MFS transporter [Pseudolabrys sp.]|nr:MFS transporter [Pseudolabrys sp.]